MDDGCLKILDGCSAKMVQLCLSHPPTKAMIRLWKQVDVAQFSWCLARALPLCKSSVVMLDHAVKGGCPVP